MAVTIGYRMTSHAILPSPKHEETIPDAPAEPPRNFTFAQLRYFDGTKHEKFPDEDKPVYVSLNNIVFDVSQGRDFYGPGGPYEVFAGRECGVALAKMSFDETHLDTTGELNFGERQELDGWIQKFQYYRNYPILGKLVTSLPDPERIITREELAKQNGTGEIPEGYAAAPIYVAVDQFVFDMSFGGVSFYGKGGPYQNFAGKNVTRALSLMKIEEAGNEDMSDVTEKQLNTMREWVKTFRDKKQYPIVGKLKEAS